MSDITVFIGDSVTDCNRIDLPPYGNGYVNNIVKSGRLAGDIINVGTSGHRLVDLKARWEMDVLAHNPTCVSVAIGINDTWRRYDDNDATDVADFEANYREVLDLTKGAGVTQLVLCEPFLLEVTDEMPTWREDLDPKIDVVHRLAAEYGADLVPFDQHLHELAEVHLKTALAEDGIHPSPYGHQKMAELWLDSTGR